MNSWFGNISVNLKLALGFGLVLALTAVLAVIGWSSLGALINRSNWMGDITQLNASLTTLRISRLQYMLANGDDQVAATVQSNLDAFVTRQQDLLHSFKSPENLKLLKEQNGIIGQYEQSLDKMRNAYKSSQAARQTMGEHASTVQGLISQIMEQTLQLPADDANRFAQFRAITQVKEAFQLTRYEVRGYTATPNPQTEQKALRQLDSATDSLKLLDTHFGASQQASLTQLKQALDQYRVAVQRYKDTDNTIIQARQEMTKQGYDIVDLSDRL